MSAISSAMSSSNHSRRAFFHFFSRHLHKFFAQSVRKWRYDSLNLLILPDVLHPGSFPSSTILLHHLEQLSLKGKSFLEMGCGTGVQACLAARAGARASACDITSVACENARLNAERNEADIQVFHSDVFYGIPEDYTFDVIATNPPHIPRYPEDDFEFAFYCGENFEFFKSLFNDLSSRLNRGGCMIMVLPASAAVSVVIELARDGGVSDTVLEEKGNRGKSFSLYGFFSD